MVDYELDDFELTQEQIDALGGNALLITRIPVWDPFPPAGWLIVALGPSSGRVVCPKPCQSVTLPPP